ncbi:antitoxin [Rothia sp. P6271]|uniref:type II toxin-antitoxin system RelB family antitoxin n=1 Tax=unclassified Rothia (in: high G+C Gram-positive bacteria) TaxID=2689056 RepID=UPI003AD7B056
MATTSDSVLTVRIPTTLKKRLNALAQRTERPVAFYVKEALEQSISELEHAYELQTCAQAVREGRARTYTLDEVRAELGL